jgi:hypothetical protein
MAPNSKNGFRSTKYDALGRVSQLGKATGAFVDASACESDHYRPCPKCPLFSRGLSQWPQNSL